MKKYKILALLLVLSLALVACGDAKDKQEANSTAQNEQGTTNTETEKPATKPQEVSKEALMAMAPTPAEDFELIGNAGSEYEIKKYIGNDEMVYIPDEINGAPVTRLSSSAFSFENGKGVKAIRLGKNIKTISESSFMRNKDIEILIMEGVEHIGDGAFIQATNLKVIELNEGIKSIGDVAFSESGVLELVFPVSLEKVSNGIFFNQVDGFKLTLDKDMPVYDEVKAMADSLGYEVITKGLDTETQNEEPDKEPHLATKAQNPLREALMAIEPSPVEDFEFYNTGTGFQVVEKYLGDDEFVYIPEEVDGIPVKSLRSEAFSNKNAKGVRGVRLGKNFETIDSAFGGDYDPNKSIEIIITEGAKKLDDGAFIFIPNLKYLELNEGIEDVGEFVFAKNSLSEIVFPLSIKKVSDRIFWGNMEGVDVIVDRKSPLYNEIKTNLESAGGKITTK